MKNVQTERIVACIKILSQYLPRETNQIRENSKSVVLTDIFPVTAVAATVGFRWPLCINHTKKAVKFKYFQAVSVLFSTRHFSVF
jgi:hypothetical protein